MPKVVAKEQKFDDLFTAISSITEWRKDDKVQSKVFTRLVELEKSTTLDCDSITVFFSTLLVITATCL